MEEEHKSRRPRIGDRHTNAREDAGSEKFEKTGYNRDNRGRYNNDRRNNNYNSNNNRSYNSRPYNNNGNNEPDGNRFTVDREDSTRGANHNMERDYNRKPFQQRSYGNSGGYGQKRPQQYGSSGEQRQYNNDNNRNRYDNGGSYGQGDQKRPYQPNRYRSNTPNEEGNNMSRQYSDSPRPRYNNSSNNNNNNNNNNNQRYQNRNTDNRPYNNRRSVPEPLLYKAPFEATESIRLNKYLSTAGVCSRREADEHIVNGKVKVNGKTITELGTKILFGDIVTIHDKVITPEHKVYVLLNKPKDCVTTTSDPQNRLTVMDLIRKACPERILPVGRLDRNTTGVLLLTNDGELASKLTHPQYIKKKIYHVVTDKDVTEEDMQRIADGIELSDGPIHADAISYVNDEDKDQIGIEIHSGRNRIIRRIFETLGYKVKRLDRVYFAGLTKKDLSRGRWRYLTREEVNMLHMGSFE